MTLKSNRIVGVLDALIGRRPIVFVHTLGLQTGLHEPIRSTSLQTSLDGVELIIQT